MCSVVIVVALAFRNASVSAGSESVVARVSGAPALPRYGAQRERRTTEGIGAIREPNVDTVESEAAQTHRSRGDRASVRPWRYGWDLTRDHSDALGLDGGLDRVRDDGGATDDDHLLNAEACQGGIRHCRQNISGRQQNRVGTGIDATNDATVRDRARSE